ncbi:MAG TPA: 5-formyltetrahydrofolate cyclo-ligase [Stellaceae bacterium]|nr:5-formyltetrahydrofolate cyclo-ligase [Stellaceae bacterium]
MSEFQSWGEIAVWRKERRRALMAARAALGAVQHRAKSGAISGRLDAFLPALQGGLVGIYWPIRHEFDPLPFARRFIAAGGAVALPVVIALGKPLEFRRWTEASEMAKGVYDIPYPATGEAVAPAALIVPLLGFDDAGYRLGYGAGYYDRTFASFATKPLALGVGFALGRLPTIYPQPHDVPMDHVVTEEGAYDRAAGRLVPAEA